MSRIAIIDLVYNFPLGGGASVDIHEVAKRLLKDNHEVCFFLPNYKHHGVMEDIETKVPYQVKRVNFSPMNFNKYQAGKVFLREMETYKSDHVFITDGWSMKCHIVNDLAPFRPVVRFYCYEMVCLNLFGFFNIENKLCPKNYLEEDNQSFDDCVHCACVKAGKLAVEKQKFKHEFINSQAFLPSYKDAVKKALSNASVIIVYNEFIADKARAYNKDVRVTPSGIDCSRFKPGFANKGEYVNIFMAGRVNDKLKGFECLRKACNLLYENSQNFRLYITTNLHFDEPYLRSTGWLSQNELAELYQYMDICVVPSVWQEPFGIVALEGMASGKPLIVTNVGGLKTIVEDNISGFIVEPDNPESLASKLKLLIDAPELREKMGIAGRKRAEELYDWDYLYEKHYRKLFA
ncbi:glycosyltransferase family 4 protein [bacterium]|nr:glycosyltransferase family 4 protein [bacterium]